MDAFIIADAARAMPHTLRAINGEDETIAELERSPSGPRTCASLPRRTGAEATGYESEGGLRSRTR